VLKKLVIALLTVTGFVAENRVAQGQTWTPLRNQPSLSLSNCLLLTDGGVICQAGSAWLKLTPDSFGSYLNGTWSQIASFPSGYMPAAYASAVLADGRVVVVGGEDNNGIFDLTNQGAIYDPRANIWTSLTPPSNISYVGDAPALVLADGRFLLGSKLNQSLAILNPSTLTWTSVTQTGKIDTFNSEEGWTLLPDGSVFTLDVQNAPASERFIPATFTWVSAGNTPVDLHTPPSSGPIQVPNGPLYIPPGEIGPGILRPDGTVFAVGANGLTAIFTPPPANSSAPGTWVQGPSMPNGLNVQDGPGALLPSGNVLVVGSPGASGTGTQFFEFNGSTLSPVPVPLRSSSQATFVLQFLVLPTGQVLMVDGSNTVEIYTSNGTYNPSWAPSISSVPSTVQNGDTYSISGTQFNGLSQATAYGDESQDATNYPLIRITNATTGRVFYARTHDHSSMGVATGTAAVSTNFDVPANIQAGASTLVVVANGIPSAPVSVNIASTAPAVAEADLSVTSLSFGTQGLGSTSAAQTATLTNSGLAPLTISSLTASGAGFAISNNGCGGSLTAGAHCVISVTFAPSVAGTVSGAVTINDNSSTGATQSILLSGTGTIGTIAGAFLASGPFPGTMRNDFSGFVGMRFTVGGAPLIISQLGRWVVAGNSQTHTLKLADASGNDLPGGSASLNLNGLGGGQYAYAPLTASITLAANTSYYLTTGETTGGDQWYDHGPVTAGSAGVVNGAAYQYNGAFTFSNVSGTAYGTPNLLYQTSNSQTPPAVSITAPVSGAVVSGQTTLTATASASSGLTIAGVQFQLDGVNTGPVLTSAPYSAALNTIAVSNGVHSLTAVATDSSGNGNVSATVQFTVSNSTSGSGTPFLTGSPTGSLRHDYSGYVGMKFTIGASAVSVNQLGRWVVAGSNQTHLVKMVDGSGNDLPGGSASITLSGAAPGQYAYAPLPIALTLAANTSYYLVTQEFAAGDQWYDHGPVTANSSVGIVNSSAYQYNGVYYQASDGSSSYGPANFLFGTASSGGQPPTVSITLPANGAVVSNSITLSANAAAAAGATIASVQFRLNAANLGSAITTLPYSMSLDTTALANGLYTLSAFAIDSTGSSATSAPIQFTVSNTQSTSGTPFLTGGPASTSLRNDYTGFVGMQFTVGSGPLTVSALGRWVVAGSSQTHVVKLVAANGGDLIGGFVALNVSGAQTSQYAYTPLASPVTLSANTTYYLMTQEFAGGDKWYNYGPVTASAANGFINSAAYQYNGTYYLTNTSATAYGPANFLFGSGSTSPQPPTISITTPVPGANVSGTMTISATASAAAGLTIAGVQFKLNGANLGASLTAAPYSTTLDTTALSNATYTITAVATDSVGTSNVSSPVQITVNNATGASGTPFLTTGPPSTSLRNDYAGFVGMQFTTGAISINVTELGRWVAASSSQSHLLKLVTANGVDVAGGSTLLSLAGAPVGKYAYAALASPITLPANTAYYLLSQEFAGGDKWYDYGTVSANTAGGLVVTAAYQYNGVYYLTNSGPSSYGPPNFLFR